MSTQNNDLEKKNVNKKYILVAAVAVIAIGALVLGTKKDGTGTNKDTQQGQAVLSAQEYQPTTGFDDIQKEELGNLMTTYFQAYEKGDFATLETVASPLSEMEKSYITEMNKFYEQHRNIQVYYKQGLSKDSYIVTVICDLKYHGKEQTVPSLLLFYVQTKENGSLYINNLYSDFNLVHSEKEFDWNVYGAMDKYTKHEDFMKLASEVDTAYQKVLSENADMKSLLEDKNKAYKNWKTTVYDVNKTTESTEETPSTEVVPSTEAVPSTEEAPSTETVPSTQETPNQEIPSSEETPNTQEMTPPVEQQPQAPTKVKVHADTLNIRESASADSRLLLQLDQSDVCTKLGVEGDWTKVEYNGVVGFVKSEFLTDVTE